MIIPKIKALFQFIEFLYSNIENFKSNDELIKELELLGIERQKVSSKKTFNDKLKYDEVQAEIETKFKILQDNTATRIKAKAIELNVCNFDNNHLFGWYGVQTDIRELKENFTESDLPEIFEHKRKYIEYRTNSHKSFLSLSFFFNDLDEILKELFGFFNESEKNEFEAFEAKRIEVNNIKDALGLLIEGKSKISINPKFEPNMNDEYNDMFAVSRKKAKFDLGNGKVQHIMHTTKETYDLENANVYNKETGEIVEKGTRTNYNTDFLLRLNRLYILEVKPYLNHHFTNSKNRQDFFDYVKYAALNTEIIKHEGKKTAIQDWVNEKETGLKGNPVPKTESIKTNEVAKEMHNHIFKENAFEVWQTMFDSFQITESSRTDVKFMFEAMKKDNLIHNTVNQKTFLNWISDTYQITVEKTSNYSKTTARKSIYSNAKQLYKVQGT
jgi:hypothetical protein